MCSGTMRCMIWNYKSLLKLDFLQVGVILLLMLASVCVISATTDLDHPVFLTPYVKSQIKWFMLGSVVYLFFAGLDYRVLKRLSPAFYLGMIVLLIGLFFVAPIQNVHRWYKIPVLNFTFQPSEYAKLIVVIALSAYLSDHLDLIRQHRGFWKPLGLVLVPFLLILKEPDLGTALVLYPIALGLFYLADLNPRLVRWMSALAVIGFIFVALMFTKVLSHESLRPYVTIFLKDYQYERLNPNTYHQNASQMAIALGRLSGCGFKKSEFTGGGWLPAAHTDSIFAAYVEEYGFIGTFFLLTLFFILIYLGLRVARLAKDPFGRFLSLGVSVTVAMHVFINMGMMCGFLPITGVPLVMMSYGGSSVLSTMSSLGILQSIYTRRYLFS